MLYYRLFRGLFRVIAAPMFRLRVVGAEHVPKSGPGVVVAAHHSWLDPACVGAACPRPVRFLILTTVFHRRWTRWFYRMMGGLPVRTGGTESVASIRGALRLLGQGELIGVFPQGRVMPEGRVGPLHPGAAAFSVRSRAPVIPFHVQGSARAWPHGRSLPRPAPVSVRIGIPIPPPPPDDGNAVDEMLARIEAGLRDLAEEAGA